MQLSKTRIAAFEQCPKRLWLQAYSSRRLDGAALIDFRILEGLKVGKAARSLYPDGRLIETQNGIAAALEQTRDLISGGWRKPVFEATFARDNVLVQADLMLPSGAKNWRVAEVKSSTSPKEHHFGDLATQLWVMDANEIVIDAASIMHVDSSFVLANDGDYEGLFSEYECLADIQDIVVDRTSFVEDAKSALAGDEPKVEMGDHCGHPFACEFQEYCSRDLPEEPDYPVTLLPNKSGKQLANTLLEQGIDDLRTAPQELFDNEKLARIHRATQTGDAFIDRDAIAKETESWRFPRHFLDFETIGFAVPRWIGARPYQQIPFQFSCHTQKESGEITHREFLSIGGEDPRRACAEALVDLLPIVRNHYYHRDQLGSWSIKAVVPTICPDLDYGALEVKAGDDAQAAYVEAIETNDAARRNAIRDALLAYCKLDTLAMVRMLKVLLSA